MIEEAIVNFKTAKLLREKGFDEICTHEYGMPNIDEGYVLQKWCIYSGQVKNSDLVEDAYAAPTQQIAMRWLREDHGLFIQFRIVPHSTETIEQKYYFYSIFKNRREISSYYEKSFYFTYEEAVDAALEYVLENLI